MHGELTPEQQLRVLGKVWGVNRPGYVFLPWIKGDVSSAEARKSNYHEGRAYSWPREKAAILSHIKSHPGDDLYFSVNVFNGKRRIEQYVDAEKVLYADLDPVSPESVPQEMRPTVAWESSPGRYQAVWIMSDTLTGATWPGKENHRLTMMLGADPSGWDATQLLRIPGRPNHKPSYGERAVPGRLLWDNGPRYVWSDFSGLPEVGIAGSGNGDEDIELVDDELLDGVDRFEVWATVRLKVKHKIREYMNLQDVGDLDRSEVLWQIERELADAGCSLVEIIALIRPTIWNKYAGRNDELKRLKLEAAKAISARSNTLEPSVGDEVDKPDVQWLAAIAAKPIPRPRWLVHDIWTRGGCGFIAGAPKSYKSWLALDLAFSVASGCDWLGHRVAHTGPVLYLQEEDDLALVMSRLSTIIDAKDESLHWHGRLEGPVTTQNVDTGITPGDAGARRSGGPRNAARRVSWSPPVREIPLAMHVQTGFIASDPSWQAWLTEMCATHRFALVVIDTLGTTAGDIDTDKAGDLMLKLLKPLKTIANEHDAAVCVVHHNKKANGQGGRAGQDMLGSVALHAWVDCAIYARSKQGQEVVIEREAKASTDLVHTLKIPTMGVHGDVRVLWSPEIVGRESNEAPAAPAKEPSVMYRLKSMGLARGIPRDQILSVFTDQRPIEKAVEGGWIEWKDSRLFARAQ